MVRDYILYMKRQGISQETHKKLLALRERSPKDAGGRGWMAAAGLASTRIRMAVGAMMSGKLG